MLGFIIAGCDPRPRDQALSWRLTAMDGGYFLPEILVQGVVIGLLGA